MSTMTTTTSADSLALLLRSLKLPTVARLAEEIAQQAEKEHMFPGPLRADRRFPGCRPRLHHPARRIVPPVLPWARSDRRSTPTPLGRDLIG